MKNEWSGFQQYIKHYWKNRGKTIPVFGHVGGLQVLVNGLNAEPDGLKSAQNN